HADPIAPADGQLPTPPARQLSACQDGEAGTVARISDADPEMLRYFDSVGISLDSHVRVVARRDFAGVISVAIQSPGGSHDAAADEDTSVQVELGNPAAEAIWVVA
ncbi:FeoA family protein, partial [Mycobacterium sp. GA-1841]|uniref:FeoA family protein n=1 Tax=Mycobacterium sp. GA-1841 TaxID=1834154 RepID=UPI0011154B4F